MVFGGGKKHREAEAATERARKEVAFWKDQLDHAVDEKNALLERYTELYRHTYALEHAVSTLGVENKELRHVMDRTALHESRATPPTPTSQCSGASTPDGRSLQHTLTATRAALKQADVRIAILEDRNLTLQQENDLLHKQNELLRSSEAAYQKEAQLLREELSNARGINDLTADETTKLLLDNSRLQQAVVAARSEVLHKDEMLRLLSAEINELNAKLEWYATATAGLGVEASWDQSLAAEASSGSAAGTALVSHPITSAESQTPQVSQGGAVPAPAAVAEGQDGPPAGAAPLVGGGISAGSAQVPTANGQLARKSGGRNSSEAPAAGSAEAAVEALATALPLRLSTQVVMRISTERRGTFSGQPITPRDISELKHKLEQEGSKTARQRATAKQQAKEGSAGGAAALPPLPTPPGSSGGAAAAAAASVLLAAAAAASNSCAAAQQQHQEKQQQQQQPEVQTADDDLADGELDDVDMLQGSPNLSESLQRSLVRESTPNLLLTASEPTMSPAAIAATISAASLGGPVAASDALPVELAVSDTSSLKVVTSKQIATVAVAVAAGSTAAATAASSAANTPKAAGTLHPHSPSKLMSPLAAAVPAVNEFKLAARVAPPPEVTCPDDNAAAATAAPAPAPVELSELQPGIPQRQQALARLAAEQQQVSAARAAAAAAARSAGGAGAVTAGSGGSATAEPSPRTNLAAAMVNPIALVAAAAAAGVIDEPEAAAMTSAAIEPAAATATAAAAMSVCQRQAALARLAVEQDARIQQQQQPSARSRSNSPAGREPSQRRAAVTRLGISGQTEHETATVAAAADTNDAAAEAAPDNKAAAAGAERCSSGSGGGTSPPKDDAEGGPGSPGGSNREAAHKTANGAAPAGKTSGSTGTKPSSVSAGKQQQSKEPAPVADSKEDAEPAKQQQEQEQSKQQERTAADPGTAAASASNPPEDAAPAAVAATANLAAVRVKSDSGDLPRSNSLKDRIAAMNAANQQQHSPYGSPKSPFGSRPSSGGGGKAAMSRFVATQQEAAADKAVAAVAVPSKIPQQPAEAPTAATASAKGSNGGSTLSVKIAAKLPSKIPSVSVSPKSADASAATTPQAAAADAAGQQAGGSSSSSRTSSSGGAVDAQVEIRLVSPAADASSAEAKDSSTTSSADKSPKAGGNKGVAKATKTAAAAAAAFGDVQQSAILASSGGSSKPAPAPEAAAAPKDVNAASQDGTGVGAKIAVMRRISTSSSGGLDDTVERDGTENATATPPKRQLSNRMAAMRAAFEGK